MTSTEAKNKLLHYWRFRRRYMFVATEVGGYNADVMVSDGNAEIIECEVKVSKADLMNEFKHKKEKHEAYMYPDKVSAWFRSERPTHYYLAVPFKLRKVALKLAKNTPYGVIMIRKLDATRYVSACVQLKKAKPICDRFSKGLFRRLVMRNSSEFYSLRDKLFQKSKVK